MPHPCQGGERACERGVGFLKTKNPIGIIGLGVMGSAMANNLLKAGFRVHGFDIAQPARNALKRGGGHPEKTAVEVAAAAQVLITSLPSAKALHAIAVELTGKGGVVMETSTLPIDEKQRAREVLAKKGITLLDCPLSGTGAQARAKDLVVFASGDKAAFKKAEPFMPGFSRARYYLGDFGNGSKMKFVANLLVAIHNVSTAEAFVLGMKAGLDAKTIYEVMANSAGSSRMFQVRGPQMVANKYDEATISVGLFQKDMKIIGDFATQLGVSTPLFNASAAVYNAAMGQGMDKQDTAAVCAVLERLAGLRR
ncbi:MAG TPA: NAD(P)-dependent oxidoreductase [Burkholderiales bacterium]|nr:NAD(P)-dependent oxidoreductase [Burkholderiales bacterium]